MRVCIIKYSDETDFQGNRKILEEYELVLCKDCVKRHSFDCPHTHAQQLFAEDEWFCADGKRRGA